MFCEECGAKNDKGIKFCASCGSAASPVPPREEMIKKKEEAKKPDTAVDFKPQRDDYLRATGEALTIGWFTNIGLVLLMSYQYFNKSTGLYDFWVSTCNSVVPFCSSIGHLGESPISQNENFIAYFGMLLIISPLLWLPIILPYTLSSVSEERKCKACSKKWSIFPTGKSTLVSQSEFTSNERKSEQEYRGDHKYTRDVFYNCTYLSSQYIDDYSCRSCNDKTKRERQTQTLIDRKIAGVGGWISVK
jgi:hypothetical protein